MIRSIVAAAAMLLTACGTQSSTQDGPAGGGPEPTVTVVGDTTFLELPVGRSADNGELEVSLDGVTEDSRCPSDVQCVWAGNAGVRLTLKTRDETDVVIINSTSQPQAIGFQGFAVGFRELQPYPTSTEPIDSDEYVATIWVVDTR